MSSPGRAFKSPARSCTLSSSSRSCLNLPSVPEGQEDVPCPATPAVQQPQVASSDGMEKSSSNNSDSSSRGKIEIDNTNVGKGAEPMQTQTSASSNEQMTPQRARRLWTEIDEASSPLQKKVKTEG